MDKVGVCPPSINMTGDLSSRLFKTLTVVLPIVCPGPVTVILM